MSATRFKRVLGEKPPEDKDDQDQLEYIGSQRGRSRKPETPAYKPRSAQYNWQVTHEAHREAVRAWLRDGTRSSVSVPRVDAFNAALDLLAAAEKLPSSDSGDG